MQYSFEDLKERLQGELYYTSSFTDQAQLLVYSSDASVYQEKPLAVAVPATVSDIKHLIDFARSNKMTLIPRAAGTSLAGQVVGNGVVVDISKYFSRILEVNESEKWVLVEPGVIRDDLNRHLQPYGLMFGPETSTANRAMIGGMVGNNSCGLHSIVWGSARDHLLEARVLLSDGTETVFKQEPPDPSFPGLKGDVYKGLYSILTNPANSDLIRSNFPKKSVSRRNTGYALDALLDMEPFTPEGKPFNVCKLIAGSEGTLAFTTALKLSLIDLPPKESALVCIHCRSIGEALHANIVALGHKPMASELVDKYIMDFTIGHPEYSKNRFFIEGDPAAILMVEFMGNEMELVKQQAYGFIEELQLLNLGYAFPTLYNKETSFAWDVRKAGLGLLRNLRGDAQPVNLIEDCAVAPEDLPAYIEDLRLLLEQHQVKASYYAHAGAGELHVEPIINLKTAEGLTIFRSILKETTQLVKKYQGSLSGEHGDGRLRGEFIEAAVGPEVFQLFREVKALFDPGKIFNAGKITDTPAMDASLRVKTGIAVKEPQTVFDFSYQGGIKTLAEKCSGSGDCRKTALAGGTMCPSFMATRQEKDSTRARANILRQFLNDPDDTKPFDHEEIKEVMDLCLSCKACKIECPSSVDITKMKAEFLQQYYKHKGIPFRVQLVGNFSAQLKLASFVPGVYNAIYSTPVLRRTLNRMVGFHPERTMPLLYTTTLRKWFAKRKVTRQERIKSVVFFCDEFTNFLDVEIGQKAIMLLEALGYQVIMPEHLESGRTYLSKGLVIKAKNIANKNIEILSEVVSDEVPVIGVEPSAILTLRDEYPDLANNQFKPAAARLARNTFTIEEFLSMETQKGFISPVRFEKAKKKIVVHGHCYQKALSSQLHIKKILSIPVNYEVELIPSGCCGMAGSFGYEKEHYDISQKIGELVLFPAVRKLADDLLIAASGTSCRHQIKDGTEKKALHPVEILWHALLK
ncbi:MAG: FAD-binding protein [Chitinophagaceae bacterium]|nr:FAD-binding protein [Chitinophagaceae bacterium]